MTVKPGKQLASDIFEHRQSLCASLNRRSKSFRRGKALPDGNLQSQQGRQNVTVLRIR
ncbi:hypothetical protein CIT292_09117 [Citrobacter youngae ATCC 29220]|uniref:Uncharacterized protein n=1 Tax=Citrobacter youngae ATCC 29220 TaxID=500640 RepID=D4BFU7_9ENTR|nr:hypothetical protein CIT292_09117 [Citrobacter youngae ATCC 29220]